MFKEYMQIYFNLRHHFLFCFQCLQIIIQSWFFRKWFGDENENGLLFCFLWKFQFVVELIPFTLLLHSRPLRYGVAGNKGCNQSEYGAETGSDDGVWGMNLDRDFLVVFVHAVVTEPCNRHNGDKS